MNDSDLGNSEFTYVVVLIGVILGMGIVHILSSLATMIQERGRVRFYWIQLLWSASLFLLMVQYWYSTYSWSGLGDNFGGYLYHMSFPACLYFASAILLPPIEQNGRVCCKTVYFSHNMWFFGISAIGIGILLLESLLLARGNPLDGDNLMRVTGFLIVLTLGLSKNERLHALGASSALGLVTYYCFKYSNDFFRV